MQSRCPRKQLNGGLARSRGHGLAIYDELEVGGEAVPLPGGIGVQFLLGGRAIVVGVDLADQLKGRNLRCIDHVLNHETVAMHLDPGVAVDREVSERVRQGRPRHYQSGRETAHDGKYENQTATSTNHHVPSGPVSRRGQLLLKQIYGGGRLADHSATTLPVSLPRATGAVEVHRGRRLQRRRSEGVRGARA